MDANKLNLAEALAFCEKIADQGVREIVRRGVLIAPSALTGGHEAPDMLTFVTILKDTLEDPTFASNNMVGHQIEPRLGSVIQQRLTRSNAKNGDTAFEYAMRIENPAVRSLVVRGLIRTISWLERNPSSSIDIAMHARLLAAVFRDARFIKHVLSTKTVIPTFELGTIESEDVLQLYRNGVRDFVGAKVRGTRLTGERLVYADFTAADLTEATLQQVDLSNGSLSHANVSNGNLGRANLYEVNLSHANLRNANLKEANLRNASLRGADLSGADISGADLSGADLRDADFSDAIITGTHFDDSAFTSLRPGLDRKHKPN